MAAPGEFLFSYFICKQAALAGTGDRWPREPCGDCSCKKVSAYQGVLADEHKIDWALPENQP